MILVLWSLVKRGKGCEELAFVQSMSCVPNLDEMHEAVRRVCLQSAAAGSRQKRHEKKKEEEDREAVVAGKCFVAISFPSVVPAVDVVWANIAINLFLTELHWCSKRVYGIRLFRESTMKRRRVHE